eukprot:CAMPEP_0185846304 /NCGR_PEP_ID=MMETSP1354-20130828/1989_1 /TAXON_ID=708628 /ORGANISM="Erythrolobus madagascarensis, Strain CCMP3276" /LENGTH=874 /DNA_ID=CAMNT_0028546419 /DNA_START=20 /DNA_END=2644 /DNA_ORIENTATION=-
MNVIPQVSVVRAGKTDVGSVLYHALTEGGGAPSASQSTAMKHLQSLRGEVFTLTSLPQTPRTLEAAALLARYLRLTRYISGRATSKVIASHAEFAPFSWIAPSSKSPNGEVDVLTVDIAVEQAALLFDAAMVLVAVAADGLITGKRSVESLRDAAKRLQLAAGALEFACKIASEEYLPESNIGLSGSNSSINAEVLANGCLGKESLLALQKLTLANAQSVFHELACSSALAGDSVARIAAGARELYASAAHSLLAVGAHDIGAAAEVLAALYDAEAESRMALHARANHDMENRLARLTNAMHIVYQARAKLVPALRSAKNRCESSGTRSPIPASLADKRALMDAVEKRLALMDAELRQRFAAAEEENQLLVCQPATGLKCVESRISVKPADAANVIDALDGAAGVRKKDIEADRQVMAAFAVFKAAESAPTRSVAPPVRGSGGPEYIEAASKRSLEASEPLRSSAASAREDLSMLSSLKLAEVTGSAPGGNTPEQSRLSTENEAAANSIKGALGSGGLNTLEQLRGQVKLMSNETSTQLKEIIAELAREAADDALLQQKLQDSPHLLQNRKKSEEIAAPYRRSCDTIFGELHAAARADKTVVDQLASHKERLYAMSTELSVADVDKLISVSSSPLLSQADADAIMTKGAQLEQKLAAEVAEAESLLKAMDRAHSADVAAAGSGMSEETVDVRMERVYGQLEAKMKESKSKLDLSCGAFDGFEKERFALSEAGRDSYEHELQRVVGAHAESAVQWHTLFGHLQQGVQFYTKEQDNLKKMREDVDGFLASRKAQADEILAAMMSSGANISGTNPYSERVQNISSQPPSGMYTAYQHPQPPPGAPPAYLQQQYYTSSHPPPQAFQHPPYDPNNPPRR